MTNSKSSNAQDDPEGHSCSSDAAVGRFASRSFATFLAMNVLIQALAAFGVASDFAAGVGFGLLLAVAVVLGWRWFG